MAATRSYCSEQPSPAEQSTSPADHRGTTEIGGVRPPTHPSPAGGRRRIYSFGPDGKTTWQLQTEESNPDEHPDYLVPNPTPGTFRIPREFFTNLWIFALTDTEIAAYLTLTFLRWRFPAQHYARGSTSWTRRLFPPHAGHLARH